MAELLTEVNKEKKSFKDLGITYEEKAFYDALTRPQAVKDVYENEVLVAMTRELTETLRKNRTIDWQIKESARAGMRKMVKRLLKKYKYPPEETEHALDIVLKQCEEWADDEEHLKPLVLNNVEDDLDVRNLIFNRLQLDDTTTDLQLQQEVIELFGERYPDMKQNDWRHIIEDYTPMVRNANKAREIPLQPRHLDMAAEGGIRREQSGITEDDL